MAARVPTSFLRSVGKDIRTDDVCFCTLTGLVCVLLFYGTQCVQLVHTLPLEKVEEM